MRNAKEKRALRDTEEAEMTGLGRQDVGAREEKSKIAFRF